MPRLGPIVATANECAFDPHGRCRSHPFSQRWLEPHNVPHPRKMDILAYRRTQRRQRQSHHQHQPWRTGETQTQTKQQIRTLVHCFPQSLPDDTSSPSIVPPLPTSTAAASLHTSSLASFLSNSFVCVSWRAAVCCWRVLLECAGVRVCSSPGVRDEWHV